MIFPLEVFDSILYYFRHSQVVIQATWAAKCKDEDKDKFSCLIHFYDETKADTADSDGSLEEGISVASDTNTDIGPRPDLPPSCDVASPRSDLQLKSCKAFIDDYCYLGMIQI